jgi:hypothetical protein
MAMYHILLAPLLRCLHCATMFYAPLTAVQRPGHKLIVVMNASRWSAPFFVRPSIGLGYGAGPHGTPCERALLRVHARDCLRFIARISPTALVLLRLLCLLRSIYCAYCVCCARFIALITSIALGTLRSLRLLCLVNCAYCDYCTRFIALIANIVLGLLHLLRLLCWVYCAFGDYCAWFIALSRQCHRRNGPRNLQTAVLSINSG